MQRLVNTMPIFYKYMDRNIPIDMEHAWVRHRSARARPSVVSTLWTLKDYLCDG